jgi:chorismate mutase / prephenate dehydratase
MPACFGYLFRPHPAREMSSPAHIDAPAAPPAPAAEAHDPPPQDGWPGGLAGLRAELDRIDDQLHGLLMQRALVVEQVAKSGKPGVFRPGREASIIRRLLRRHGGGLPVHALVRIWRELLAGTTAMQGPFTVAVCEADGAADFTQAAREHFGALTPLRVHHRPAQVMAEVSGGGASVGVLPYPSETKTPRDAWWTALLHTSEPRIYVVARLPFWAPRAEGATTVQSLVIAALAPDASDRDRSLLGLELDVDVSRARLTQTLINAGLPPGSVILRRDQDAQVAHALVEVDGHLADDDPRLTGIAAVRRRPILIGAYAIPEDGGAA